MGSSSAPTGEPDVTPSAYRHGMANRFLESWQEHAVTTPAGELTYIVFPGGARPFIGCTRVAGRQVAPVDARRLLAELDHEHAELACIGDDWPDTLGRRPGT